MRVRAGAAVALPVLLLVAFPTTAQLDEAQPYFSLQSNKTFAPGEKPSIGFWGRGIDKLQFRVYRVSDPVRFFEQLDDPHRFGGQARRVPGELTALERFHRWKSNSRSWLRNLVRAQYTPQSRAEIRASMLESEARQAKRATQLNEYANVPLLNQQQVVSVWEQPIPKGNRWETQRIPIDVKDKGVYLVEATDGKLQAYTMVCVTGLASIVKGSPGKLMTRVVDRKTGDPVAGAGVIVYAGHQEQSKSDTDAEGMAGAQISIAGDENALVLVRTKDDFTPGSVYGWSVSNEQERVTSYVYTDRPVYRPGHTVHYKAILRATTATGYAVPQLTAVELQIQDPEGNPMLRKTVQPSAMGTISGELTLNAAALGYYGIELKAGSRYLGNGGFQVEEYKKPEYEVRVTPEQKRVIQGEAVKATIEGKYYFGEPVAGAAVKYAIYKSRYWPPYWEQDAGDEGGMSAEAGDDENYEGEQQGEQTGKLDAQGRLTVSIPTVQGKYDMRYRIEAKVTDPANREISGTGYVLATVGSYFVHIEPSQYVYSTGQKANLRVEAKDYEGKPVPNAAFTVDLLETKYSDGKRSERVLRSAEGRTGDDGAGSVEIPVDAGSLVARVRSKTPAGREVQAETWLWVSGGGYDWGGAQRQRVEIIPDKKSYKSGDTAKVLIVTGVPHASIWVTAESRAIQFSKLVTANSPTVTVDIPVRSDFAPNVFVIATFVREGQLYQGSKSLKVPPVEQEMQVTVKASQAQFKPGESGVFTVDAKNNGGAAVAGADFSLGVVDEAIYAIRKESGPDIERFFYGATYNSVSTESSLNYSFSGEAGKRRMQLAALRASPLTAHGQLKGERFVDPKVRKAFPDTIYWAADLRTDARGHAEARVEFPDSLTTWRATARGVTLDTKVGGAVERVIVRKNLILRLGAPRFFREKDEVVIPAIVQNYLADEKTARVSLDVKGLELIEGGTREIKVPSKGTAQADFRVRAKTAGEAVLLGKALTNEESDALELTLPVLPDGVAMHEAKAGAIRGAATDAEVKFAFPQDANGSGRTLEITVTPSVAGAVFGALDYLTSFPYGCTEQTMSSFLPNIVVAQAAKELNLRSTVDEAALQKKIRAGFDRLYEYQHPDGGWGWWKSDDSQPFMTAYVVAGLARARAAGYKVRPGVLDNGSAWLKKEIPSLAKQAADLQAYVAYALAENGTPDAGLTTSLWDKRSDLTPYGIALLGLTMKGAKDSRSGELASLLEQKAKVDGDEAFWPTTRDGLLDIFEDVTPEATAFAMKLLTAERPSSDLLPKAALYLVNHRNEGYYWLSTKQTAMVVFGLTDYLKQSGELKPDFGVTVTINGKAAIQKRFTAADALAGGQPIRIETSQQANTVHIAKSGQGTLYWSVRENYNSLASRQSNTGSGSLALRREYFKLVPQKSGDKIVYDLQPAGAQWQKGDVIAVRLTVTGSAWRYLLIEDPIPAGTEFEEKDGLYELMQKPDWWATWWARRELHDDRIALFQTYFPSGGTVHTYLLKVVNPGRYSVSPTRVEPMYQPQFFATGDAATVEVK